MSELGNRDENNENNENNPSAKGQDYNQPIARLLSLGEPQEEWADYSAFGLDQTQAAELIRLATDRRLHPETPQSSADYGPWHAWRAIGQLNITEALLPLFGRLDEEKLGESLLGEELIEVCLELGGTSRTVLEGIVQDTARPGHVRAQAAVCLAGVVEEDPEQSKGVAVVLAEQLEQCSDRVLGSGLVEALVNLESTAGAEQIEKAYQRGIVDVELVGPWDEVRVALGLEPDEEETKYFGPPLQPFHPSMAPFRVAPPDDSSDSDRRKSKGKKRRKRR